MHLLITKIGSFGKVRNSDACESKNTVTYLMSTYRTIVKSFTANNLRKFFAMKRHIFQNWFTEWDYTALFEADIFLEISVI